MICFGAKQFMLLKDFVLSIVNPAFQILRIMQFIIMKVCWLFGLLPEENCR
jgi:hypothetical protein